MKDWHLKNNCRAFAHNGVARAIYLSYYCSITSARQSLINTMLGAAVC